MIHDFDQYILICPQIKEIDFENKDFPLLGFDFSKLAIFTDNFIKKYINTDEQHIISNLKMELQLLWN